MTNPFANIQPAQPEKSLQVLSVSNVHSLSRITSANGQLCPDYTRYLIHDYRADWEGYRFENTFSVFDTLSHTLLMKTKKYNKECYYQLSRNGYKLLAKNEVYDCTSGQIIHKIPPITNIICDWDFNFCYAIESGRDFSCYIIAQKKQEKFFNVGAIEGYFGPISPDGSLIVIDLKNKSDEYAIIDTKEKRVLHRIHHPRYNYRSHFSLDNLSWFIEGNEVSGWAMNEVSIWAMNDGKCVYRDPNSHSIVSNLDSTLLFLAGNDGIIHIYDVKQWREIHQIHLDYTNYMKKDSSLNDLYRSTCLDISSDGTKLLIVYVGGREIWGVY